MRQQACYDRHHLQQYNLHVIIYFNKIIISLAIYKFKFARSLQHARTSPKNATKQYFSLLILGKVGKLCHLHLLHLPASTPWVHYMYTHIYLYIHIYIYIYILFFCNNAYNAYKFYNS